MELSIGSGVKYGAIPLLSRLMRPGGVRTKLDAAALLLSVVAPIFTNRRVCIMVDSWYMKRPYLERVKQDGFHAIGQVRRDTALNDLPQPRSGGGRPRK